MNLVRWLGVLALKELIPPTCKALGIHIGANVIDKVSDFLTERFTDHSQRLTNALRTAIDRAWKALEIALAGESFWNWLDRGEDKALRRQIRAFLDAIPPEHLPAERDEFRRQCLDELRAARRAGLLDGQPPEPRQLAYQAAAFARFADPRGLLDAEWQVVHELADDLAQHGYAHLARFLDLRPAPGQSLLAVAVRYFFRRAMEEDRKLFQGLAWVTWENLAEGQERGFAQLHQALKDHGQELELHLTELHAYVVQIHGAVLDIREEQRRQGEQHRDLYEAVLNVQRRLDGMAQEHRPHDSLAVRCEDERQLLKLVLGRYRALPPEQQRQMPALLHGVARLQEQAGDADEARNSFATLTTILTDRKARAEAHYHAYRAALERRDWPKALASYQEATAFDPESWTEERLCVELGEALQLAPEAAAAHLRRLRGQTWH